MTSFEIDNKLVKTYLKLLSNLSVDARLEIISQLSLSLKKPAKESKATSDFAGCWESEETAEELIEMIRSARTFNRQIQSF